MMKKRRCVLSCFVLSCLVLSCLVLYFLLLFSFPPILLYHHFLHSSFYHASPSLITSFFLLHFASPFSNHFSYFAVTTFTAFSFIFFIVISSSFQMNPMTEKREETDPDTTRLCEMRIQKITSLGGIPVLAK